MARTATGPPPAPTSPRAPKPATDSPSVPRSPIGDSQYQPSQVPQQEVRMRQVPAPPPPPDQSVARGRLQPHLTAAFRTPMRRRANVIAAVRTRALPLAPDPPLLR